VTDPTDDDRERTADEPAEDQRRSVWGHRIAVAILLAFGAFVLFNVVTVLVLVLSSAAHGGGGPFGR
jgi:hypothetical protein